MKILELKKKIFELEEDIKSAEDEISSVSCKFRKLNEVVQEKLVLTTQKAATAIISHQDDIDYSNAVEFYDQFSDRSHGAFEDCPAGNKQSCPKCRVRDAEDLAAYIMIKVRMDDEQ